MLVRIALGATIDFAPRRGADVGEIGEGINANGCRELDTFPLAKLAPLVRQDEINPDRDVQ